MAGFFSSLFGSDKPKAPEYEQLVFMNAQARYKYLLKYLQAAPAKGEKVLLIAWFPKTLEELTFLLNELQMPFEQGFSPARTPQPGITLDLAENVLKAATIPAALDITVLVGEHYPLYNPEMELMQKLQNLVSSKPHIVASMEGPVFEIFGAERLKKLMASMGMHPDEVIQHDMVKKSVQRAQQKLEEKVTREQKTHSPEEWIQKNVQ